jgi:hypothetical protein
MGTMTPTAVTRAHVWAAFRRAPDVRLRERYHRILRLMDGKSCPEVAQRLPSGFIGMRRLSAVGRERSMRLGCQGWSGHRVQGAPRD